MEPRHETHGKYRPIAELGQGGTANVYLAVASGPSDFNKLVVLKVLKRELAGEEEFRRMFMGEARLSARLNHPNVVQTNEVFEADGRPVIVMEYLEGQPLSRIAARARGDETFRARFSLALHLSILIESLSGIHYSHELADYDGTPLGVVHRDITPQNVFVSYDGRVCVLDFGIAKLRNVHETQTGVIKGKLRYMPPEQLLGEGVDRRADIFAVGVMLWEAATGTKLWDGMADPTVVHHVLQGRIPAPRETNPAVPPELERIVMKALAHDPAQRYATAADLQADLEAFAAHTLPSPRELGALVSDMFLDQRRKMKALIERQIASLAAKKLGDDTGSELAMPTGSFLPAAYTSSVSEVPATASSASGARRAWFLGLTVLLLGSLLVAWRLRREDAASVSGRPATAVEMRERVPAGTARPESAQPRAGLSTAAGATPITPPSAPGANEVVEPASATVAREPEPFEGPRASQSRSPRRDPKRRRANQSHNGRARVTTPSDTDRTPVRETPTSNAAQQDDCEVPYYVDAAGIRRIKRECLSNAE